MKLNLRRIWEEVEEGEKLKCEREREPKFWRKFALFGMHTFNSESTSIVSQYAPGVLALPCASNRELQFEASDVCSDNSHDEIKLSFATIFAVTLSDSQASYPLCIVHSGFYLIRDERKKLCAEMTVLCRNRSSFRVEIALRLRARHPLFLDLSTLS